MFKSVLSVSLGILLVLSVSVNSLSHPPVNPLISSTEPSLRALTESSVFVVPSAISSILPELYNLTFGKSNELAQASLALSQKGLSFSTYLQHDLALQEALYSHELASAVNLADSMGQGLYPAINNGRLNLSEAGADMSHVTGFYGGRNWAYVPSSYIEVSSSDQTGDTVPPERSGSTPPEVQTGVYRILVGAYISPLVIDLDQNGVIDTFNHEWLPHVDEWSEQLVSFDLTANGFPDLVEWIGPNDGLLVSNYSSGAAINGANLFGTGDGWSNGYEKLRCWDSDDNGILEEEELKGLFIWRDLNHDAVVQNTEIKPALDWGVTAISLVYSSEMTSTAKLNGTTVTIWDWYPNSLYAFPVESSPSSSLPSLLAKPFIPPSSPGEAGLPFAVSSLDSVGIDTNLTSLVGITNQGAVIFLAKITNFELEQQGYHWAILTLQKVDTSSQEKSDFSLVLKQYLLPVSSVGNLYPFKEGNALLIFANAGSTLLNLDLNTGELTSLYQATPGESTFLFSNQASLIDDTFLYARGTFLDENGTYLGDSIIKLELSSGSLVPLLNLDQYLADQGVPVSYGLTGITGNAFALSYRTDLVHVLFYLNGVTTEIARVYQLRGMWAAGDKLVYIAQSVQDAPWELRLYDVMSGQTLILATGDFVYPMISVNGNTLIAAQYNFTALTATYYVASAKNNYQLTELLANVPIGTTRISPDGEAVVYYSAYGGLYTFSLASQEEPTSITSSQSTEPEHTVTTTVTVTQIYSNMTTLTVTVTSEVTTLHTVTSPFSVTFSNFTTFLRSSQASVNNFVSYSFLLPLTMLAGTLVISGTRKKKR